MLDEASSIDNLYALSPDDILGIAASYPFMLDGAFSAAVVYAVLLDEIIAIAISYAVFLDGAFSIAATYALSLDWASDVAVLQQVSSADDAPAVDYVESSRQPKSYY